MSFSSRTTSLLNLSILLVGSALPRPAVADGPAPGKKWALIVGLNYKRSSYESAKIEEPNRSKVPALRNAVHDAEALAALLKKHYGYDENIVLLREEEATKERILDVVSDWSRPHDGLDEAPASPGPNDSVLVFFAGHGTRWSDLGAVRGPADGNGVVYPFNTQFQGATPRERTVVDIQRDIIEPLKKCRARHKLVIFDSCHAGEILANHVLLSRTDERQLTSDAIPSFQALVSCRAWQRASDGPDDHSPFSTVLLRALRMIPARHKDKDRITVTEIFEHMGPDLHDLLPETQFPKLGFLTRDEGEFCFFPEDLGELAKAFDAVTESKILRALTPGENGSWWFDETPWIMPSLRRFILEEVPVTLRSDVSEAISREKLSESVELAVAKLQTAGLSALKKKRLEHLERLFFNVDRLPARDLYQLLAADYEEMRRDRKQALDPEDLHFLAVLYHAANRPEAKRAYQEALEAYKGMSEKARKGANAPASSFIDMLWGLCHVDQGYFELTARDNPHAALLQFRQGRKKISDHLQGRVPPPFNIFVLCQEADAWHRLGMPGKAEHCLKMAHNLCNSYVPRQHPLRAYVLRQKAWAFMEQWKVADAENEFLASTAALTPGDFDGRITRLHNDHGLAMALRFRGDSRAAVQKYRAIGAAILNELFELRQDASHDRDPETMKSRWVERFVNTQERLADCNIFQFAEPAYLGDAVDDLRRALRACGYLPSTREAVARSAIQFKLCLALSLASPVQDLGLAQGFLEDAEKGDKTIQASALLFPSTLIPRLHHLLRAVHLPAADPGKAKALAELRQAIQALERKSHLSSSRDHLELLLFATKVLLEQINVEQDRFQAWNDAELMAGLCRRALQGGAAEVRPYLRPYYDAVFRTKVRINANHVRDLIDLHWEATQGSILRKRDGEHAILALYFLREQAWLILELPGGHGKALAAEFTRPELARAWRRAARSSCPAASGNRSGKPLPRFGPKIRKRPRIPRGRWRQTPSRSKCVGKSGRQAADLRPRRRSALSRLFRHF
jgi:hypothetical protein